MTETGSAPTHRVDAKLAAWIVAYERLKQAQAEYKAQGLNRETSEALRADIDRLQRKAELALREMQAEIHAASDRAAKPGPH